MWVTGRIDDNTSTLDLSSDHPRDLAAQLLGLAPDAHIIGTPDLAPHLAQLGRFLLDTADALATQSTEPALPTAPELQATRAKRRGQEATGDRLCATRDFGCGHHRLRSAPTGPLRFPEAGHRLRGAKKRAADAGAVEVDDPSGLIRWLAPGRGIVEFRDHEDLKAKLPATIDLADRWMRATAEQEPHLTHPCV